jgi:hypothetical protein
MEKLKFLTLPELEFRPLCHPTRRQLLYRLCYPSSSSEWYFPYILRNTGNTDTMFGTCIREGCIIFSVVILLHLMINTKPIWSKEVNLFITWKLIKIADMSIKNQVAHSIDLCHSWTATGWSVTKKNFPTLFVTLKFITTFTTAHHWSLSCDRSIQSVPRHPVFLRSILIFCSFTSISP